MTTDITDLAQSHELLIANGNETAHLLRHLADNEIDSDYFAVVTECESYGMEVDAELEITTFALRAAEHVAALVEALEKAQQQNISDFEIKARLCKESNSLHDGLREAEKRIAELESRTVTVKLPDDEDGQAYGFGKWANRAIPAAAGTMMISYCEDAWRAAFEVFSNAAGIKWEDE